MPDKNLVELTSHQMLTFNSGRATSAATIDAANQYSSQESLPAVQDVRLG